MHEKSLKLSSQVLPAYHHILCHQWHQLLIFPFPWFDVCLRRSILNRELMRFDRKLPRLLLETFSPSSQLDERKTRVLIWFMNSFYLISTLKFFSLGLVRPRNEIDETRGQSVDKSCCSYRNPEFLSQEGRKSFLLSLHTWFLLRNYTMFCLFLISSRLFLDWLDARCVRQQSSWWW